MNKKDYVLLHTLLAKLKYELEVDLCSVNNESHVTEIRGHIEAIDDIMKIFVMGGDSNE